MTEVTRSDRVIELSSQGGRGRDGVTGDYVQLVQTNGLAADVISEPANAGAAYGIGTTFAIRVEYSAPGGSIQYRISGLINDPLILKYQDGVTNVGTDDFPVGTQLIFRGEPLGDGIAYLRLIAPGLDKATPAEVVDALKPGLGVGTVAVTPEGLGGYAEAMGVMMNRLHMLRPTKSKPYAAMRMSALRWWVATNVKDGHRQDYVIHEFVNRGPFMSPAIDYCWSYNGIVVAHVDGLYEDLANFSGENTGGGQMDSLTPPNWEAGVRMGPHASWPTGFDYVGAAHGHLKNPGCGIFINGGGTNYRDPENAPIGVVIRGTSFTIDQSFDTYLPDNTTPAGTMTLAHTAVSGGVNESCRYTLAGSNTGITTAMGCGLAGRGDMLKGNGIAAIAADREDGLDYGAGGVLNANLGELTTFQLYNSDRDTIILEAELSGGGPMSLNGGPYGWSENGANRDSWLQDRADGYAKVYSTGINRNNSGLYAAGTTLDFNVTYRVRKGALI